MITVIVVVPEEKTKYKKKPRKIKSPVVEPKTREVYIPNVYIPTESDMRNICISIIGSIHSNLMKNDIYTADSTTRGRPKNIDETFGSGLNMIAHIAKLDNCNKTELCRKLADELASVVDVKSLARELGVSRVEYMKKIRSAVIKRLDPAEGWFYDKNDIRLPTKRKPMTNLDSAKIK